MSLVIVNCSVSTLCHLRDYSIGAAFPRCMCQLRDSSSVSTLLWSQRFSALSVGSGVSTRCVSQLRDSFNVSTLYQSQRFSAVSVERLQVLVFPHTVCIS